MAVASTNTGTSYPAIATPRAPNGVFNKRVMQTSAHEWQETIFSRLEEVVRLPINWDGYGGTPVGFGTAHFTMSMLHSACPVGSPAPQIVPGSDGGLQVEWHSLEYDIELHVHAPFKVSAVRYHGDNIEEFALTNEFSAIAVWLKDLEIAVAARSAAA